MNKFERGDAVMVDLGAVAKVRPCIVVSLSGLDSKRNMSVVVPMTTEIRQGECEVAFPKPPWLQEISVVNLLGIVGVDNTRIQRRITAMPVETMGKIDQGLKRIFGFRENPPRQAKA